MPVSIWNKLQLPQYFFYPFAQLLKQKKAPVLLKDFTCLFIVPFALHGTFLAYEGFALCDVGMLTF